MEITGLNSQVLYTGSNEPLSRNSDAAKPLTEQNSTRGNPQPLPAPDNDTESNTSEKSRGVIHLLQEGHFKGVADVRLRINFFDELNAIEQIKVKDIVADKVPGILDSVGSGIEMFLEFEELDQEQSTRVFDDFETFIQNVNLSMNEFLGAEEPSTDNLVASVAGAFDDFISSLKAALSPEIPEVAGEDLAPAENMGVEVPPDNPDMKETGNGGGAGAGSGK